MGISESGQPTSNVCRRATGGMTPVDTPLTKLPAESRPAFTDPPAHRLQPLLGFCHLEGSDQPFEIQLQTAWVNFGKQMRITFAGPRRIAYDGTSGSPLFRKEPTEPWMPPAGERFENEFSTPRSFIFRRCRTRFFSASPGNAETGHSPRTDRSCRSVSAYSELVSLVKRRSACREERLGLTSETSSLHAGSRLHHETHVALFAQARLAQDLVPINLNCHGSV